MVRWKSQQSSVGRIVVAAYQLLLVLDGQRGLRQDGRQVNLVLLLDASLCECGLPLVCEASRGAILLEHSNLLAGILERVDASLKLLLILLGVLAAYKDLNGHLATLQRLQIRGCMLCQCFVLLSGVSA